MKTDFYSEVKRINESFSGNADFFLAREEFHTLFARLQEESIVKNDDRYIFALFSLRNFLRKAYLSPDRPKRQTRINIGAFINALTVSCSFLFGSDGKKAFAVSLPTDISAETDDVLFSAAATEIIGNSLLYSKRSHTLVSGGISGDMLFISAESFGDFSAYDFCRETNKGRGLSFCLGAARALHGTLLLGCGSGTAKNYQKLTLGASVKNIKRENPDLFLAETKRLVSEFLDDNLSVPHIFMPPV
ncbi:MAG: hypothetical protein MR019_06480 [Ruminococcus sp.]|nr:hypothetical protein [Ruminococcus sp.]MDY3896087.1 hypothetical protein [Candidatus Fimenecus sp.]